MFPDYAEDQLIEIVPQVDPSGAPIEDDEDEEDDEAETTRLSRGSGTASACRLPASGALVPRLRPWVTAREAVRPKPSAGCHQRLEGGRWRPSLGRARGAGAW